MVTRVANKKLKKEVYLPPREGIGTWGLLMENEAGEVTFITEGEIVEQNLFNAK